MKLKLLVAVCLIATALVGVSSVFAQVSEGSTCFQYTRDLALGSRGADVSQLQAFLKGKGFFNADISGYYGEKTRIAVANFQKSVGITPSNGKFGLSTRTYLNKSCTITTSTSPSVTQPSIQPSLTITSPNGGEVLKAGLMHTITWDYFPGDINGDGRVNIDDFGIMDGDYTYGSKHPVDIILYDTSGGNYVEVSSIAKSIPANKSSYGWNVSETIPSGSTYKIKIVSVSTPEQEGSFADESNGLFEINSVTRPTTGDIASPTGVIATSNGPTQINLSWKNNASNQTGFLIERSVDGGKTFSTLTTVLANATSYTDTGLKPEAKYMYRIRATNASGSSFPTYPITANALADFAASTHPEPARTGGWSWTRPPNYVAPDSARPGNIFYSDQQPHFYLNPISFQLSGFAKKYEVRDYYGKLVESGAVTQTDDLTLQPLKPGWYKLYLFNSESTAQGDVVGDTTFAVFNRNANFPSVDDMIVSGGYWRGFKFIKKFSRIDPVINFPDWKTGPNPIDGTTPYISDPNNPNPETYQNTFFAVRWTGQIVAPTTGAYTFTFNSLPEHTRLSINGRTILNLINGYNTKYTDTPVQLVAGQRYDINLEYVHNDRRFAPTFQPLKWSTGSMAATIVPQSALYSSASAQTADGLTGTYYEFLETPSPMDQTMRSVTAMGPQRYAADVTTDQKMAESIKIIEAGIAVDKKLYVGKDSQRSRPLMIAFSNGTAGYLNRVAQVVEHFKNDVKYYEPENEPNFSYSGSSFVPVMRDFYNTVKGVDPSLKVMGPGVVSIGPGYGMPWHESFFQAGGGNYIDALSFHFYNGINGDFVMGKKSMDALRAKMAQYNISAKELWQTEQGFFAAMYGAYLPRHQGRWTMSEMMVFDQYALPKEHNVLWYDVSHGFWDFPTWWENDSGGVNPAVPLMRTWSEELFGTKYVSAFNFGNSTDEIYIGNLYSGVGKSVAVFMTNGAIDGKVTLSVNSGSALKTVDAWGNRGTVSVTNGKAVLPVDELPVYVELASGQTINVVQEDWGANLARRAGVTVEASGSLTHPVSPGLPNSISKVIDGTLQNWYYNQGTNDHSWMANNAGEVPATIQFNLGTTTKVSRVIVRAPTPWQWDGAPLDYLLQYDDNGTWVTIEHVQEHPRTFGIYSTATRTSVDSYYSQRSIFMHSFQPVSTSKIRLVVNDVTYGGGALKMVQEAGGQTGPHQLTLQEVEIFGQ